MGSTMLPGYEEEEEVTGWRGGLKGTALYQAEAGRSYITLVGVFVKPKVEDAPPILKRWGDAPDETAVSGVLDVEQQGVTTVLFFVHLGIVHDVAEPGGAGAPLGLFF